MTAKFCAILTHQGAARLANAAALGTKLNLTQMAVGDANGKLPTPDPAQTKLINQKRIAPLNMLSIDPKNTSQIIAEQIIPENEGGWWIREIGLYDNTGVLIAVANCPETYKPLLQEGSGRTQTIRMLLIVSSTSDITLKIDPAVVLATRQYVDDSAKERVPLTRKVNGKALSGDIAVTSQDIFNTQAIPIPDEADLNTYTTPGIYYQNMTRYVQSGKNYPTLVAGSLEIYRSAGITQVYRAYVGSNCFVRSMYGGSWSAWTQVYDTQNKPKPADIGALPSTGGLMTGAILASNTGRGSFASQYDVAAPLCRDIDTAAASEYWPIIKQRYLQKESSWSMGMLINSGDFYAYYRTKAGESASFVFSKSGTFTPQSYANFDLRYALRSEQYPIGAPIPWPQSAVPSGFLLCNGQAFNKTTYPLLATAYPSGTLPDLRGEFIRGLDAGRGVDSGRAVLSSQSDAIRDITGGFTIDDQMLGSNYPPFGAFKVLDGKVNYDATSNRNNDGLKMEFKASNDVPTASENRPRNIAFSYIVRAA